MAGAFNINLTYISNSVSISNYPGLGYYFCVFIINTLQKIHSAIFSQFLFQNQDMQVTYFMSCNSNP